MLSSSCSPSISELADLYDGVDSDARQAQRRMLRESFRQRLISVVSSRVRQLYHTDSIPSDIQQIVARCIQLVETADLAQRRTEGLSLLSELILRLYSFSAEDRTTPWGGLMPFAMKSGASASASEIEQYSRYYPSVTESDAHPDAEILLVGEAPGFTEVKVGIPLADLWNIASSVCSTCRHSERCLYNVSLLPSGVQKPSFGMRVIGCEYESLPDGAARARRISMSGTNVYTAGELLRRLLVKAGIGRASWGDYLSMVGVRAMAVVTNASRWASFRKSSTGLSNGETSESWVQAHAPWLWLEAAMMQPRATVLLGGVALLGYSAATGSRKSKGSGLLDYQFPFGAVYKTYHPAAVMHAGGVRPWQVDALLEKAATADVQHQDVVRDRFWKGAMAVVHLLDTLHAAVRSLQRQDALDDPQLGYSDILPSYITEYASDVITDRASEEV